MIIYDRCQIYHMINIIIQKIVTDRRQHDATDDFSSTFGMAVGTVVQNFNDLNRLKGIEREFKTLKEQYDQLSNEKDQLHNEVQKLRILPSQMEYEAQIQRNTHLKKENDSLRDVLKTSKETIAMLQNRLAESQEPKITKKKSILQKDSLVVPKTSHITVSEGSSPRRKSVDVKQSKSMDLGERKSMDMVKERRSMDVRVSLQYRKKTIVFNWFIRCCLRESNGLKKTRNPTATLVWATFLDLCLAKRKNTTPQTVTINQKPL